MRMARQNKLEGCWKIPWPRQVIILYIYKISDFVHQKSQQTLQVRGLNSSKAKGKLHEKMLKMAIYPRLTMVPSPVILFFTFSRFHKYENVKFHVFTFSYFIFFTFFGQAPDSSIGHTHFRPHFKFFFSLTVLGDMIAMWEMASVFYIMYKQSEYGLQCECFGRTALLEI